MSKDKMKRFKRMLARQVYYFFIWYLTVMPYWVVRIMTNMFIFIAYGFLWRMKAHARESLTIAFGNEKSPAEIKKIFKRCFEGFGRGALELGYFCMHPHLLKQKAFFAPGSKELIDKALAEGKGVVLITAHFGNFPLMLLYMAQAGYPTNAIIRPSRDEKIEIDFQRVRSSMGLKTIHSYPRPACVRESLRVLRNNELLIIPTDQNTGSKSGVYVDFFGQKAGTPTGATIFALRTGAPIMPIFTVRDHDDVSRIMVEPHFYVEKKATDAETIQYNTQRITTIIERYIRAYPHEWGWMHKRWKSRPNETPATTTPEVADVA